MRAPMDPRAGGTPPDLPEVQIPPVRLAPGPAASPPEDRMIVLS